MMNLINLLKTNLLSNHLPTNTATTITMDTTRMGTTMTTTSELSQAAPVYEESQVQISGDVHLPFKQALQQSLKSINIYKITTR